MISLYQKLVNGIGKDQVFTDDLTLIATSADAGCYSKVPKIVIKPEQEQQVIESLDILYENSTPVTFRAAGTSLSGQAISDSVLLQARGDGWSKYEILENGSFIKTQPGITGTRLNQVLAPYQVKFGPDPASIDSAMVGGIIANNASGMSCGTHANSYATIQSARIILADGTLIDTADPESRKAFTEQKSQLINTIADLKERITSKPDLVKKIREKYRIKNTTGYGLNSFLDFDDPVDIILHLMVGSEGTLGFISEATFNTIPVKPFRASALIYFKNLESACNAVPHLRKAQMSAIEIMDREALRSVEDNPGIPEYIRTFDNEVTALLIDLEAENQDALENLIVETQKALAGFDLVRDFEVTDDRRQIAAYWDVRKGVFPSVGGMRRPGTSVIIEDVAVHADHLTGAVIDMRRMLDELDYKDAVIYGHVLDGNLHFIFAQDFHDPAELRKYENMIAQLTRLIVDKYNGSLKAEHGTGLNMAPFVQYEWGEELYGFLKEIKAAFDPRGILNPDVIISDDPELHLKHFKPMPIVDESVDQCIECGFCEINCLSNGFTLSARQRIVVQREIEMLRNAKENPERLQNLVQSFRYAGNESCAGDGLCAVTCPLSIDTGVMIKNMRSRVNRSKKLGNFLASWIANHFKTTHWFIRTGLGTLDLLRRLLGIRVLKFIMSVVRTLSFKMIPAWDQHMPGPVQSKQIASPSVRETELRVVYFPSCINQSMGPSASDGEKKPLLQITLEVLEKAGYQVIFPQEMKSLCCGTPWESKGFMDIADAKSAELEKALLHASDGGKIPVLCDTSPCTHRMKKVMSKDLDLYEPVEFIHDHLLDKLKLTRTDDKLAFHVTCTSTKMGLHDKFVKVAEACTEKPLFPEEVGCCGFAGDKGFSIPALNRWSLRNLEKQTLDHSAGYSNSRTCEIGLSRSSGIDYKSIMYLVHQSIEQE
ncbi:MAG: FAD-binding oxidoreductase [Bacteroidales bacterium]|nr:FAD-binding oxidoreductase [Bacteroidales bacterium]